MLKEPAYEYPRLQGKSRVCLEGGQYRAYLDRDAALELLFGLHWFATEQPMGEEIDIWTRNEAEIPCKGRSIGLCEFNLVPAHKHKKHGGTILKEPQTIRDKPHGVYTAAHDRLDFFVSPDEVSLAYETLDALLAGTEARKRVSEVTLFGTLFIRLIA